RGDRVQEGQQIGNAHEIDGGGVEIRRASNAGQNGVAAVAATVDSDTVPVDDALINQPLDTVRDVVLHGQAPLPKTGLPELSPVAGRAAEVHLQDAVPPICQELRFWIETPAVARPRPAMRIHHAGQALRIPALGQGQVAVYD